MSQEKKGALLIWHPRNIKMLPSFIQSPQSNKGNDQLICTRGNTVWIYIYKQNIPSRVEKKSEHSQQKLFQQEGHSALEHNLSNGCHPRNNQQELAETII